MLPRYDRNLDRPFLPLAGHLDLVLFIQHFDVSIGLSHCHDQSAVPRPGLHIDGHTRQQEQSPQNRSTDQKQFFLVFEKRIRPLCDRLFRLRLRADRFCRCRGEIVEKVCEARHRGRFDRLACRRDV